LKDKQESAAKAIKDLQ
jgi:chromosome segregation ATPase